MAPSNSVAALKTTPPPAPPAQWSWATTIHVVVPSIFFLLEFICALGYTPSYSYAQNFISDLGVPYAFSDPAQGGAISHSRLAWLMNVNFFVTGLLYPIAALFLVDNFWRYGRRSYANCWLWFLRVALACVHAVGSVMVGSVPGGPKEKASGADKIHGLGAVFSIGFGNIYTIYAGIMSLLDGSAPAFSRLIGLVSIMDGVGGTVAALSIDPKGGLNVGAIERVAAYAVYAGMYLKAYELATLDRRRREKKTS